MSSFYKAIELNLQFYHMSKGLAFEIFNTIFVKLLPLLGFDWKMAFAKFQENRFNVTLDIVYHFFRANGIYTIYVFMQ